MLSVFPSEAAEWTLTILHTGGFGGRFEQILKVGPVARQIRRDVGGVLLLDTGDALAPFEEALIRPNGMPSLTVDLFNRAEYDAWLLGERDLGREMDSLTGYLRGAEFPVLGANLHRRATGRYLFQVQPYAVVRIAGLRIGMLGLSSGDGETLVADPAAAAAYYVPLLRQASDVVVLLTNLGFRADSTLAASVPGIDVIAGGDPRTARKVPDRVNGVLVGYSGGEGAALGRIDLTVSEGTVADGTSRQVPLDITAEGPDDAAAAFEGWAVKVEGEAVPLMSVLGTAAGGFDPLSKAGSAMGNLTADLVRTQAASEVAFVAARGVRPELPEGPVRVLDLCRIYAPPNRLVILSLDGQQVRELLEWSLRSPENHLYPSGLEVVYDPFRPAGERVVSVVAGDKPLDLRGTYRVAMEDETARTAERDGLLRGAERAEVGVAIRDLLARHIKAAGVIQGAVDGRMREK